jgi:hypothetical protein
MNLNQLAESICKLEDGKKEVNIAQVKDCIAALGTILRGMSFWKAFLVFLAIRNRAGKA